MLVDDFLPAYDVSDAVALAVAANVQRTWDALMQVDLIEVGRKRPTVALLGALRAFPAIVSHALHGQLPRHAPERMRVHDLVDLPPEEGGWVLLGERPGEEVAFGLVGKFWRPVIPFVHLGAAEFLAYAEPGYAKTIYALSVRALGDDCTLLSGTMRTATTDEQARRWFHRYWTLGVGSGAHVLVHGLLEVTRDIAERPS